MKETGYVIQKSKALTEEELESINHYTRREFKEAELYAFSVVLCDNEIDRDFECFTESALEKLSALFLGRTGIFNHNPQAQNQTARIYDCCVERVPAKTTKEGNPYCRLVAQAYLPRSEKNADFILELESGMKKEVSVGCAMGRVTCSVCGADLKSKGCTHQKGKTYHGTLCHAILDEPTDAYEWSFVAVPAQREAGVIKSFESHGEPYEKELAELRELAEYGKRYRSELENSVVKFCTMVQPGVSAQVMRRTAERMNVDDLQAFEKAFRSRAEEILPLAPQLAPLKRGAEQQNTAYRIV